MEPAPDAGQCEQIFAAALRAADHGQLRPWRFLLVAGAARQQLGELYLQAALAQEGELAAGRRDKLLAMPLRAPLVVVAVARCAAHPKVPAVEMLLSAGAAVQNMLNAAHALGVGACWRTGEMAYDPLVRAGLGLASDEQIVGYLYLGTPAAPLREASVLPVGDYFQAWVPK
jgi:nitroreductase